MDAKECKSIAEELRSLASKLEGGEAEEEEDMEDSEEEEAPAKEEKKGSRLGMMIAMLGKGKK